MVESKRTSRRRRRKKMDRTGYLGFALCRTSSLRPSHERDSRAIRRGPSWQLFLEACRIVGAGSEAAIFDADSRTTETLNFLVLEIWFSEIVKNNQARAKFFDETSWPSLRQLLRDYARDLYKALSLMFEFLPRMSIKGATLSLALLTQKVSRSGIGHREYSTPEEHAVCPIANARILRH